MESATRTVSEFSKCTMYVHLKGQRHEIFDILSVSNYSLWSPMNRLKRFSEIFRLREDIREKPESS